ncbi:leucine-rich repeat-containing protein 71-like isoform X19 [Crassostrea angulata]|uniref:leucine-rich repeat-containing protein 71-like isoform X19 n=1 Tax=Magallana angulata TaxID=2784310 RepID=UPI0005C35F29|nr:leucine-rich repeat-containing protein 71 isoform X27 [Crassostrea gigas]XP_052694579.1 leucine-rich repeat-containing protein 71-like isoform X19 [Crassostrea angulata]|eukprot:XP_011439798.1 PREDICTED: leucine-rich repeat-containing protein 71-like isoform X28 [Crassostrea gigas]
MSASKKNSGANKSNPSSESNSGLSTPKSGTKTPRLSAKSRITFARVANKIKMGKKVEKSLKGEKNQSAVSQDEEDPNKTPEPYSCTGNFQADFTELCRRTGMATIPAVVHRARPPTQAAPESSKPEKGKDKGKSAITEPEPEPELDTEGENAEPPPKTYVVKDKFEFFKPCVQVEMENYDKGETVTEIYIRGWKIDDVMMNTLKQCWSVMEKLHTINLWNTGLNGETVSIMASTLPSIVNLRTLILDGNVVKEENWHELITDESPVQNLSLRHCGITDLGAKSIGEALGTVKRANTKLVSLNLAGNQISDQGAVDIANGLRMNRTLMSLSLASNQIGDKGAVKLGEVLSRFPLSHEEVVERRKQKSSMGSPDRNKSPPPSRRADSKDRPGSVRSSSQHDKNDKSKQKQSAKTKKDAGKGGKEPAKEEEKHDKSKGKKDDKGAAKKDKGGNTTGRSSGASLVADTKNAAKGKTKGKDKGKPSQAEPEDMGDSSFINPLTDEADFIEGQLWVPGNRLLINLNLSRNQIGEQGMAAILKAMQYQTTLSLGSKSGGTGLMRICVFKNKISSESDIVRKINDIMLPKDPFYKPPPQTPEVDSTS